jgi:hypothetical protein
MPNRMTRGDDWPIIAIAAVAPESYVAQEDR